MGQMFDKTRDQMTNWRWDNPCAFRDQVDHSNPQTNSSGKVKRTGERFPWYGSDDLRAKIEPPSCRQYQSGNFQAVRPLNLDDKLTRMMMMITGRTTVRRAFARALLAMAMTMTTARVRRSRRAVRKGLGQGREQRMGRGKGR